ncbi:unnamed protein product, partial [Callosobruchus maculatus]
MEKHVMREVCSMVGPDWGDGLFCPGGSTIRLGRVPLLDSQVRCILGIGEQNVISVKTDKVGQIIPESLEDKIQEKLNDGSVPFMVVATLGTTVRGAFDPIDDIADICKKYDLWLHIDAAWGGGCTAAMFYVVSKRQRDSTQCYSRGAEYLFQKDKHYDRSYDMGDKYLQCGRKCDVFKF